jgi:ABC-2 type transport system ATP-binding protein
MIELEDVSVWYGDVIALNEVTLKIDQPVIGLLGPNGAGKSTMLALLSGMRRANTGRVRVNGREPFDDPGAMAQLGLVPEPLAPPGWLTGERYVTDLARMSGMPPGRARREARRALDVMGLTKARGRAIRGYSQGMRQRVKLAQALVHGPRVLLLDEPFTGLDPSGRRLMTNALQQLAEDGTQIVFSSHVLAEVEALTENVVMLLTGRVVAQGKVRDVRGTLSAIPLTVAIQTSKPQEVARELLPLPGVHSLELRENELLVRVLHGTTFFRDLTAIGSRLPMDSFGPVDEDIESVYKMLLARREER